MSPPPSIIESAVPLGRSLQSYKTQLNYINITRSNALANLN